MNGLGLAGTGDVVQFALDRKQCGCLDVLRAHALQLTLRVADIPGAIHQAEILEHDLDRLEVIVGVHVEHGVVLVIELAVRLGAGAIALDQVFEVVIVAARVIAGIHGHEARILQKARVDAPPGTREIAGDPVDHVLLEPAVALGHGQVVDRGGRLARVDRAAHHGHGQRCEFAAGGHQGHGSQHRDRRLAYADQMAVAVDALQVADEFLNVVHIVIQVEIALGKRHQARIFPVRDVDLVVFQHGLDGIAQQRRIVAGKGRHDEHRWLVFQFGQCCRVVTEPFESTQLAERLADFNAFMDRDIDAIGIDGANPEFRLFIIFAQPMQEVEGCRNPLGKRVLAKNR